MKKKLVLYILCGDSTYNRGDRGNLLSQIALLKQTFPGVKILTDSYRPEVDRQWYNVEVFKRGLVLSKEQIKGLSQADFIVWGGGALLADNASIIKNPYWAAVISFIRYVLNKPLMAWAHGVIMETSWGRLMGRIALNQAQVISVRDYNSYSSLKRARITSKKLHITADPAVLVKAGTLQQGFEVLGKEGIPVDGTPLFALANTFCPFHYESRDLIPYMIAEPLGLRRNRGVNLIEKLKNSLAVITDRIIDKFNCRILFIPTYVAPWENDLQHFDQIRSKCKHQNKIFCLQKDDYSPESYLSIWHFLSFMLTIPLHHSIFSTVMNVPCLNLFYEPKGRDFFEMLDANDRLLDVNCLFESDAVDRVLDKIEYTLSNWSSIANKVEERLPIIQKAAQMNALLLQKELLRLRIIDEL